MSVDYNGLGGIGIKLTDDFVKNTTLTECPDFNHEEWEEDKLGYLEDIFSGTCVKVEAAGNFYSDEPLRIYLIIRGNKLSEVEENKTEFMKILSKSGITINGSDLIIISDYLIS